MIQPKKYHRGQKTLQVLARELGVSTMDLMFYHNRYAPSSDIIGDSIPEHVAVIFGPPIGYALKDGMLYQNSSLKESIWINKYEVLQNIGNTTLDYALELEFVRHSYQQLADLEAAQEAAIAARIPEAASQNNIHQVEEMDHEALDAAVEAAKKNCLGKQMLQLHYRWEGQGLNAQNNPTAILYAGPVYIANMQPQGPIEKLAATIGQAVYPAKLRFSYAEIYDLTNHGDLFSKWQQTKAKMLQEYTGDYADGIIAKADSYLQDKALLLERIQHTWFCCLYQLVVRIQFAGMEAYHTQMDFPMVVGCSVIRYKIVAEKHPFCNAKGKVVVYLQGSACDERSLEDIQQKKKHAFSSNGKPIEGSLTATAVFDTTHQYIDQLFGHIRIHLRDYCKTVGFGLYKKQGL
ncbi:MAG: hypothetical protein OIF50_16725 [Flavobacteriaceae bacterium]|nr:hypothetical protein [Flavobacteriaceae bacterium]